MTRAALKRGKQTTAYRVRFAGDERNGLLPSSSPVRRVVVQ